MPDLPFVFIWTIEQSDGLPCDPLVSVSHQFTVPVSIACEVCVIVQHERGSIRPSRSSQLVGSSGFLSDKVAPIALGKV
jgi:hypothetical protein